MSVLSNGTFGRVSKQYPAPALTRRLAERIRLAYDGAGYSTWLGAGHGSDWVPEPSQLCTNAAARRQAAKLMLADPVVKTGLLQRCSGWRSST
jgi:hypothetical protein